MINKKLTEYEEITSFCKFLENLNFFNNNPDFIKKLNKFGLIYSMNCLFDAKTIDMLAFDIWDGDNFSEDAKFAIATYILEDVKQYILNYDKQI